ncbi:MAG TPA: nucleotide disphospho-sugar-binding domain-containing protein [Solirubrobacter sp.]
MLSTSNATWLMPISRGRVITADCHRWCGFPHCPQGRPDPDGRRVGRHGDRRGARRTAPRRRHRRRAAGCQGDEQLAAAVVCHGGMGIVQKSVAAGVPIVVVPFGRDQPEVGRRIAESGAGVLVKKKDLSASRIRSSVRLALTMRPVAVSPGGPAVFADAVEELLPVGLELEAHDRSLIR